MVLKIRLENFYSIKDEVLLDFRAAKINTEGARSLSANAIDCGGEKVLKSIGLFGANASGKSNVIKAIAVCTRLILDSHLYNEGKSFGFAPFRFGGWANKPSVFSIDFIHDGIEYEYSFTLTNTEIRKESLFHYPNGRRAKVFVRDETKGMDKAKVYSFGDGVIHRPFDVATNTSRKSLYLSRASQMDRELGKKLYNFFSKNLLVEFAPLEFKKLDGLSASSLFARNKDLIFHALSICDSDISDIEIIQTPKIRSVNLLAPLSLFESAIPSYSFFQPDTYDTAVKFLTFHKADPEIPFDLFDEESAGTKQLFNMLFYLLDAVRNGKTFILDEFDLSLHTKLADFVIDMFHAGSSAQFLFTSHNTNLIDVKRLRRDQILFANKKEDGSTELYSLYDHKDFRENMDAEKGYLQGRFDAIPIVNTSLSALREILKERQAV